MKKILKKDESAVDYSDINELAEDCSPCKIEEKDIEDEIPSSKLSADKTDYDSDIRDDKELMPPPSLPLRSISIESQKSGNEGDGENKQEKKKQKKTKHTSCCNVTFKICKRRC